MVAILSQDLVPPYLFLFSLILCLLHRWREGGLWNMPHRDGPYPRVPEGRPLGGGLSDIGGLAGGAGNVSRQGGLGGAVTAVLGVPTLGLGTSYGGTAEAGAYAIGADASGVGVLEAPSRLGGDRNEERYGRRGGLVRHVHLLE